MGCYIWEDNVRLEGTDGRVMNRQVDHSLVHKAKMGDVEAFSTLYEGIYKDLYRFAYYMLGNRAEAEDAVSEAVISAFVSIRKLRSEGAFRGWMFQILANQCKKALKKHNAEYVVADCEQQAYQPEWEDAIMVKKAFSTLSEKERYILSLTIFAGYNSKEISKLMKINPNTIRSIKNRSLEKMKALIEE